MTLCDVEMSDFAEKKVEDEVVERAEDGEDDADEGPAAVSRLYHILACC